MYRDVCYKYLVGLTLFICSNGLSLAVEHLNIPLDSGDELAVERFNTKGKYLMLWFAPEYGLRPAHRKLANRLQQQNIEVWLSNIPDSLFLPNSASTIRQLRGGNIAELIAYAHHLTHKKILLAGDSYAAVIALRGAHAWQARQESSPYLIGAVLFTPYTYATVPPLGQLPEYLPVVSATNIPILIFQARNSPIFGQFKTLVSHLQQHGNPVYIRYMPDIMSLFYQQEITTAMQQQAAPLPAQINRMLPLLEKHAKLVVPIAFQNKDSTSSGIDIYLKPYHGQVSPAPFKLADTSGQTIHKSRFTGKVTIINFWATWCPPCLQEIPSLNRLKQKMQGLRFELISINYAEDKQTILDFLHRVQVDFPVLLDHEGELAKQWRVISYPSTFIIDPQGNIRYGVNAAIEWDSPELISRLKSLL